MRRATRSTSGTIGPIRPTLIEHFRPGGPEYVFSELSLTTVYFTEEINGDSENERTTLCCLRPQETELLDDYF